MRRVNEKNITGLSYQYVPSTKFNALVFGKYYYSKVKGPVNTTPGNSRPVYDYQTMTNSTAGYGFAGTYFIVPDLQVKLSMEKAYRLPTDRELFGNGDLENGNTTLKPENSLNGNLNLSYMHRFGSDHTLNVDAGFNYRGINDYIIRTINNQGYAVSTNHGKVRGLGGDLSVRYLYQDKLSVGGNFSYQDTRDRERRTVTGAESVTFNNRVPNLPYMFGNADAAYSFHGLLFGRGSVLTIGYHVQYVHSFFRSWEGEGGKITIPRQLSHDASLTYSSQGGRYNVSAEILNFTNALLYDNYSLQKPGRSFSVKFRYFFYKQHR